MATEAFFSRKTKETDIKIEISLKEKDKTSIKTSIPLLNHLLQAMAFHGGFALQLEAKGDIEVDQHHLVEDIGLVLGEAFNKLGGEKAQVKRFGYSVIPMDESLAEIALDVCGRPSLVYNVKYPQKSIGAFDISLMREFFIAFSNRARVSLHINVRYGENTHHMIEAVFKAFGKALVQAYTKDKNVLSTKGLIV